MGITVLWETFRRRSITCGRGGRATLCGNAMPDLVPQVAFLDLRGVPARDLTERLRVTALLQPNAILGAPGWSAATQF